LFSATFLIAFGVTAWVIPAHWEGWSEFPSQPAPAIPKGMTFVALLLDLYAGAHQRERQPLGRSRRRGVRLVQRHAAV
jgi:hypothetical protein